LKVLTRITNIDAGEVRIHGRVGSLLEVGTGFHQELTGRENIFLNGTILGMNRREIRRKFDEIVAFAEVGDFIDTPVKRYSSGMAVRLAFSVAVHLDAEILLVDEVLAVGDAAFQRRCTDKIEQVAAAEGRTILFVSHNMAPIRSLCRRTLVLANGSVRYLGETGMAIETYLGSMSSDEHGAGSWDLRGRDRNPPVRRLTLRGPHGRPSSYFDAGDAVSLSVELDGVEGIPRPVLGVRICGANDLAIATWVTPAGLVASPEGAPCLVELGIPALPLTPGRYTVDLWVIDVDGWRLVDLVHRAGWFEMSSIEGGHGAYQALHGDGVVTIPGSWSMVAARPTESVGLV
jgi:lipopolysaccharide transport system ATP-binding protein